jgi:Glycerol uptake facilitator and related permeases (Major Intrinsic Protein Family)
MKKYIAEMSGTMVLVLMGCGSAIFNHGVGSTAQVLTVAIAFGLAVVAMAYTIGGTSGCHISGNRSDYWLGFTLFTCHVY